jgi:hypothetical protein
VKFRPVHLLALIPAGLLAAVLGVWLWHLVNPSPEPPPSGPSVRVETRTVGGVTFEIEHEPLEPVTFVSLEGRDSLAFTRGREWLDFEERVLAVNGVAFRTPAPGDIVRWNLAGPLLINGEPQSPHPFQPRRIDAPGIDLVWDIRGGSPAPRDTLSIGWSRTGALATAHGDGTVRIWDAAKRSETVILTPEPPKEGQQGWGLRAAISPGGRAVAVTNLNDDDVTLWDVALQKQTAALGQPPGKTTEVQFLSDDWLLEARGGTLLARALPPNRGKAVPLGPVHMQFDPPFAVDAATWTVARNDGRQIAAFRLVPLVFTLFEIPLGRVENVGLSGCVAVAPDGRTLAIFNGERRLAFHDVATGKEIRPMRWRGKAATLDITAMAFAPDGRTLAVADRESIRLYDVESARERGWVTTGWVRSLAYSPDGKTLAAGLRYGSGVRLWNTADLWAKEE